MQKLRNIPKKLCKKTERKFQKNLNKKICAEVLKQNFEGKSFGKTKNSDNKKIKINFFRAKSLDQKNLQKITHNFFQNFCILCTEIFMKKLKKHS